MHWLVVAVIALIVLGPKRLPEAGRALGQGLREFRRTISESTDISATPPEKPTDHEPTGT
jgi:sec-independent protein translocase protein TatA